MAGQQVSNGFVITIDGSPLAADIEQLLVEAYVDDNRNLPDMFVLRFRDANRLVLSKAAVKIGSRIKVAVTSTDTQSPEPLISGEVTALEADFDATGTYTLIRGYDLSHRLFRGRHAETYTQVTASDVATKVARRAGLSIGTVEPTSTVFDHVSQGGVSDWHFLSGLAREIGYEVAVRDDKFEFCPPRPAAAAPVAGPAGNPMVLELGTDLLRVRSSVTSAEQVSQTQVRGWDTVQKKAIIGTAPAHTASADLPGANPADLARVFGDPTYVATDVPYRLQAEVDVAARAVAEQIAGAFAELDAVTRGNPKIRAGTAVSIDNIGAPFDGKYTVTTSRHHFDQTVGYVTQFAVTGRQERSLLGLASGNGGSPDRRLAGVVVAQVSDVNDPQGRGRVKLTYPWLSDTYVSDWARTVQPGAGKDRGATVVPEVGDEVLAAFEQGDIRRPYVVGGLHNGVDTPKVGPTDLVDTGSGEINRRSFVSRCGHRLDFLDQAGKTEGVTIRTGDDKLQLLMDATGTKLTVHSDGTVLVEARQGVTVDAAAAPSSSGAETSS